MRIFIELLSSGNSNNNNQDFYDNSKINKKKIYIYVWNGCEWKKINLYIYIYFFFGINYIVSWDIGYKILFQNVSE